MAPATDVDMLVRHRVQKRLAIEEGLGGKGHLLLGSKQRGQGS